MKGIKDIILKGSIFAVLTAVFCVGGIPSAPLVSTARAEGGVTSTTTKWSGEMTLTGENDVTVSGQVTLKADTTLTVAEGRKLTLNGGISGESYTLTVNGPGEVIINGKERGTKSDSCSGIEGNVTMNGGMLTVCGGTIDTGSNTKGAPGIWGDVTMYGGTLTATGGVGDPTYGPGIKGVVTMNGGTLTATGDGGDNYEGGTGIEGKVTMNSGTLTAAGGSGYAEGGIGINGDVTMNGGTLTAAGGRSYKSGGSGVYGDVTMYGGTLKSTGGTGGKTSGVAFYYGVIINEGKVFFTDDGTQSFSGPLELNADQKAAIAGKFLTPYPVAIGENFYPTIQDAIDAANPEDTIKLLTDVETYSRVTVSKNCILDLNGHTIDASRIKEETKTVIKILSTGNLTLNDSSEAKTGLITGGSAPSGNGGGVYANGDFTMNGGTISGNRARDYGGGVYVARGTFTMNGGKICSNTAGKSGGGVGLLDTNPVTFEMNGGTICNNEGGGVFFDEKNYSEPSNSSFILTGGTIKDNRLENGTIRNVHLANGKLITISEELKENTSIGVTTDPLPTLGSPVKITDGWKTHMSSKDPSLYFKNDDPGSAPALNADGEAELVFAYMVTVNKGTGSGSYAEGASVTIKADEPASGKRFKEWIGADDLTFTSGSKISAEATFTMPDKAVTLEAIYKDMEKVKAPLFDPDSGTYTSAQNVTISSETPDADIYYTVDGSTPTESSTKYTGPVSVTETTTIKAIAVKTDMLDSEVSSATYTISSEPSVTTYAVTVENGTGSGEYVAGATVKITADAPEDGEVFDRWTTESGVEFVDAASPETSFTMPAKKVTVSANYKDKEQEEDDSDPDPDPDPDPNPDPSPNPSPDPGSNLDPDKPAQEKTPDKVPVSDPSSSYASPEDNFAPVAPGSSEGTGGSIKNLELDFSKVKGSGVAPDNLKMTVIAGSKFTTRAKVKDKDSVHTEGGVKAKFNKKDGTATITCKKDGNATFETEEGTFKVEFKVDKPKPNKNEAKISTGTAPVTKTVKDLFGTTITGGKLTIIKEKLNGQATLNGNELTVNPAEKNTIKLQYQYLNKKYKLSIKVK